MATLFETLLGTGSGIATNLIQNDRERIIANAKTDLQKLLNEGSVTQAEYKLRLQQLQNQEDQIKSAAQKDAQQGTLGLVALIGVFVLCFGGLFLIYNRQKVD
jgi:hypothetical protein